MEQLRKEFESEVREEFIEDRIHYDDDDDLVFDKYNSVELTKYECMEFLGKHFDCIFDMEKEVCDYNEENFGEVWEGRGVVKIVMFWRYMVASQYISEFAVEMKRVEGGYYSQLNDAIISEDEDEE